MTIRGYKILVGVLAVALIITTIGWVVSTNNTGEMDFDGLSRGLTEAQSDLFVCEEDRDSQECQEVLEELSEKLAEYQEEFSATTTNE